ncbi:hypothetical protein [Nocardioides mangrovi]|uniref:Uncharacterized protein n=1 Tax=Nocardioides mangrovi TaxID=2874580 RepID=A0ABS7U9K4_9ACTN|nr:hypothetical protein [Nocardioides mangrovi]MBZ5737507.1 hypothetical protein [Nocardioides mangrovi]
MSIFNDNTPTQDEIDSVKSSNHYEQDIDPDGPERSAPMTDSERQALNDALPTSQGDNPFADVTFDSKPLTEWVPPKVRQAQRQAQRNVGRGSIRAEEDRLFEIARHDGQPDELTDAIAAARAAIAKAYDAQRQAAHPEAPGKAKSPKAKQAAVDALDDARAAVRDAIRVSEREDIREAQRSNLVAGIEPARQRAAEALTEAAAAFAEWQSLMGQVRDHDIASGAYDKAWHQHKDSRSVRPEALVGDLRRARDLANSDSPYWSGEYLAEDPTPEGELPEWTAEALQHGTEFDQSVLWRVRKKHPEDHVVREAIDRKALGHVYLSPVPVLSPSAREWDRAMGRTD